MKIESRLAAENEKLGIDEEATTLPEGVEVVDFGEEPVFCLPPGDHVLVIEDVHIGHRRRSNGTYLVQACEGSGFVKRVE